VCAVPPPLPLRWIRGCCHTHLRTGAHSCTHHSHTGVVARGEYLEPMPNSNYYVALFFVGCALAEAGAPLKFQAGHVFTKFYTTSASVWGRVLEFAERKVVGERVG
jgi:hypothetical protein